MVQIEIVLPGGAAVPAVLAAVKARGALVEDAGERLTMSIPAEHVGAAVQAAIGAARAAPGDAAGMILTVTPAAAASAAS